MEPLGTLNWLQNKLFSYIVKTLIDPEFKLKTVETGARQAVSVLTKLLSTGDFTGLKGLVSGKAMMQLKVLTSHWKMDLQSSMAIELGDNSDVEAVITGVFVDLNQGPARVIVTLYGQGCKHCNAKTVVTEFDISFEGAYSDDGLADWTIRNVKRLRVRHIPH